MKRIKYIINTDRFFSVDKDIDEANYIWELLHSHSIMNTLLTHLKL